MVLGFLIEFINVLIGDQVVNVTDGDTVRVRHTPRSRVGEDAFSDEPLTERNCPIWRRNLREETLLLRLIAIDAPETAKFGSQGQPFADEATQYLRNRCLEKVVLVKLIGKDQYGRALAVVLLENKERQCFCVPVKVRRDVGEELVHVRIPFHIGTMLKVMSLCRKDWRQSIWVGELNMMGGRKSTKNY